MDLEQRRIKTNRRNASVIKKVRITPGMIGTEEEKQQVTNLQNEILSKEEELNKMRELLARNDETDITETQRELNHLQNAFDIVQAKCDAKLQPTIEKYNKTKSMYEGILRAVESYKDSARERDSSVEAMQKRIHAISSEMDAPEVVTYDETPTYPLLKNVSSVQTDIDKLTLNTQLSALQEKTINQINTSLAKQLKEAKDREARAKARMEKAIDDKGKFLNKKPEEITHEWVMAKHKHEKLKIIMEDAKRSVQFLKETAEKINAGNKLTQEELAKMRAELKDLAKYLPTAPHSDAPKKGDGVSRGDLTTIEAQKDMHDVLLTIERSKVKITKSTLDKLRAKLAEMPDVLEKYKDDLEQTKIERQNTEDTLTKALQLRAELLSRITFAQQEKELLIQRIEEQKQELQKIEQAIDDENKKIEKQQTIMKMNEQMTKLKTMDFDRLTSTISDLIQTKSKLE